MCEDHYRELFSKNLKRIMEEQHKSQADIIRAIPEISKASISAWCNGTRMPRIYAVDRLAEYFNVPRSALICEQGKGEPAATNDTLTFKFNRLDPVQKEFVMDIIDKFIEINKKKESVTSAS